MDGGAWKAAVHGVAEGPTRLSDFTFTFHFHALEKEMATHSSALAWRIPGTGEPGGLPSIGSHSIGHDWSDLAVRHHGLQRLRLPCPSFLPVHFSSVSQSCPTLCDPMNHSTLGLPVLHQLLEFTPCPWVYSCPLSRWCHPTISSSVFPFSFCLQSFPTSGSFRMSQLFASGGQNIGSFSFNISLSSEHPGLISFRMDWLQRLLKFMSIESVCYLTISSSATLFFCLQSFSASWSFPMGHLFASGGQRIDR